MIKLDPKTKAKNIVERYTIGKREKDPFNSMYQVLAEYYLTRKADFTVNFSPGAFLNADTYDSTGSKVAHIAAGALLGMIWPEQSQNFEIVKARNISDTKENRDYFTEVTHRMDRSMNHPFGGLSLALTEYMPEEVIFGTCGIGAFDPDDIDTPDDCHFLFQPWDIKRMVVEEAANGMVNRVFYEIEKTIEQFAVQFGLENLSEKSRKTYATGLSGKLTKITIIHAIEPRYDRDPDGEGIYNMPVSSAYVELGAEHLVKESGYNGMPVFVGRLLKNLREVYGRSFGMSGLPDVQELNGVREMEIIATEKILDPPLGVLDDGRMGANTIDTSAGAVTVFNVSGKIGNQPPVFPIGTVGDLRPTKERIEELKQSLSDHFMIDRLLDLNNDVEMTAFEVNEREKFRAYVLNSIFARQYHEVFTPLVHHCFRRELERGYLGVMPNSEKHQHAVLFGEPVLVIPPEIAAAMIRGQQVYEIKYLTPAARMMKAQLASGIITTWKFANDVAQAKAGVYDGLDEDKSLQLIAEYSGGPAEIIHSAGFIKEVRDARAKQQAEQAKFQQNLDLAKAAGQMKGVPIPGVNSPSMASPLQVG